MKILKAAVIASSVLMTSGVGAQARDLTVVSWGGNFQDAQEKSSSKHSRRKLENPFSMKAGRADTAYCRPR